MTEERAIAQAALRAHILLAENHQPLTMTPGDVRTLLARYRRCLETLANAVEPVTAIENQDPDAAALSDQRPILEHRRPDAGC